MLIYIILAIVFISLAIHNSMSIISIQNFIKQKKEEDNTFYIDRNGNVYDYNGNYIGNMMNNNSRNSNSRNSNSTLYIDEDGNLYDENNNYVGTYSEDTQICATISPTTGKNITTRSTTNNKTTKPAINVRTTKGLIRTTAARK
jgi:hypothetical protein